MRCLIAQHQPTYDLTLSISCFLAALNRYTPYSKDILVYSLNKGKDSSKAAPGSPRLTFLCNLLQSAHEGRSAGKDKYQAMMLVLVGVVFMRRRHIENESSKMATSSKVEWHVPLDNMSADPFAADSLHDSDKESPVYGNLSLPVPVSATAKYYLTEKKVADLCKPKEMAFIRLITRLHLTANFREEFKLAYGETSADCFYSDIALDESQVQINGTAAPPFGNKNDENAERSTRQYKMNSGFGAKEITMFCEYENEERLSRLKAGEIVVEGIDDGDSIGRQHHSYSPSWSFPEMQGAIMNKKGEVVLREAMQQSTTRRTANHSSSGTTSASSVMLCDHYDLSDGE